jgi:hypothetical protein
MRVKKTEAIARRCSRSYKLFFSHVSGATGPKVAFGEAWSANPDKIF